MYVRIEWHVPMEKFAGFQQRAEDADLAKYHRESRTVHETYHGEGHETIEEWPFPWALAS